MWHVGWTQGTVVEDNHVGAARGASNKRKKREYRQYMNVVKSLGVWVLGANVGVGVGVWILVWPPHKGQSHSHTFPFPFRAVSGRIRR